jgi:hypothetical protein
MAAAAVAGVQPLLDAAAAAAVVVLNQTALLPLLPQRGPLPGQQQGLGLQRVLAATQGQYR